MIEQFKALWIRKERNMNRINEDIKTGQWKQMYLLYGEEAYLRNQ